MDARPRAPSGCSTCWFFMAVYISCTLPQSQGPISHRYLTNLEQSLHFVLPITVIQRCCTAVLPLIVADCLEGCSASVCLWRVCLWEPSYSISREATPTLHAVAAFHPSSRSTAHVVAPLTSATRIEVGARAIRMELHLYRGQRVADKLGSRHMRGQFGHMKIGIQEQQRICCCVDDTCHRSSELRMRV